VPALGNRWRADDRNHLAHEGSAMQGDTVETEMAIHRTAAGETYVVLFRGAAQSRDACGAIARWAADSRLAFGWYDAALMMREIRNVYPPAQPKTNWLAALADAFWRTEE
jgi:hypothetical protein